MTEQSRVDAVADALLLCSKMQIDLGKADLMQMAQAAIEASDAWLKEHLRWVVYTCGQCGDAFDTPLYGSIPCSQCNGTRTVSLGSVRLKEPAR